MSANLPWALGQMRHLYAHMVNGRLGKPEDAANGLLSPAIKEVERHEREHIELTSSVRAFFEYLDRTETTDEGREFHPISFGCCRAMWVDRINAIMADMKRLSQTPGETRPIPTSTP